MLSKLKAGLNEDEVDVLTSSYKSSVHYREAMTKELEKDIAKLESRLYSDELMVSDTWSDDTKNIVANIKAYKKVVNLLK